MKSVNHEVSLVAQVKREEDVGKDKVQGKKKPELLHTFFF